MHIQGAYIKKVGTPEYLGKYKFYRKVLDKKVRIQKDLFTDFIFDLGWRSQDQLKVTFF